MSVLITCHRCDHQFEPGEGCGGQFARCPKCGSFTSLPGAEPKPNYDCTEPFKNCPECGKDLPVKAVLCVRCGYDFRSGRRVHARPHVKPFYQNWNGNIPLRLAAAGLLLPAGTPILLWENTLWATVLLSAWVVVVILSAGTFRTASLRREERGRCTLKTTQWVIFIPFVTRTLLLDRGLMSLEASFEVGGFTGYLRSEVGDSAPIFQSLLEILVYLYLMVVAGTCVLALADDRGSRIERTTIYRCRRQGKIREIADTICKIAGLRYS
jgi:hypothetical protein